MKKLFQSKSGVNYLFPFILIATLYLLWGCAHGLLDVLNKQFQDNFNMTKAESGFVQFSVYIGYFIMALPAGLIMRHIGYKKGLITGLLLFAFGAILFIPAAMVESPYPFFIALFVLACGLCIIENGAHPCATGMGPEDGAARRINIAAAFNGIGWIVGPLIGTWLILGGTGTTFDIAKPYILVAIVVLLVCLLLCFIKLPEKEMTQEAEEAAQQAGTAKGSIWQHKAFKYALIAQFLYVGAQTGVNSFFINYVTELDTEISKHTAGLLLSIGGMGLFFVGRLLSSFFMKWISPAHLLTTFGIFATLCMAVVMMEIKMVSLIAIFCTFFFMSTMFPTIFAIGVRGMGAHTKQASSYLVMCIVGGAVFPICMGLIGQNSMALGFLLPLLAFAYITIYGLMSRKVK
ncbi:MAG: MFS transporter [Prevotella sp.]|nr:MFS transporter [Candidatus Equicola faecalis]